MKVYKNIKFFTIIIVFALIHCTTYIVDKNLIDKDSNPRFCIKTGALKDGGTTFYYGFGYQIIQWNVITSKKIDGKDVLGEEHGFEIHRFPFFVDWTMGPAINIEFQKYENRK